MVVVTVVYLIIYVGRFHSGTRDATDREHSVVNRDINQGGGGEGGASLLNGRI